MEKVIATLQNSYYDEFWVETMCGPVAGELLDLGLPGVTVNVRDAAVRDSLMTLTTLDPPVQAVVSLWADQHYGDQLHRALDALRPHTEALSAYLVTESVPLRPPALALGERTAGLANIALLRRPAEMDESSWLTR